MVASAVAVVWVVVVMVGAAQAGAEMEVCRALEVAQ